MKENDLKIPMFYSLNSHFSRGTLTILLKSKSTESNEGPPTCDYDYKNFWTLSKYSLSSNGLFVFNKKFYYVWGSLISKVGFTSL